MSNQKQQSTLKLVGVFAGVLLSFANVALADPWTETSTEVYTSNSSKLVGIGTSTPQTKLDLRGTSATAGSTFQIVGNGVSGLLLGQDSNGGVIRGQGGNSVLRFLVGGTGDEAASASGTEAMRINSSAYIGIGTTSPYTKLDIRGTSASAASTLQIIGNTVSTLLLGQDSDGGVIRGQGGNNALKFLVGGSGDQAASGSGTEMMRLTSTGLGINTTPSIDFAIGDSDTGLNQVSDGVLAVLTNNTERMRVASNGQVGIGDNNPSADLTVTSTDSDPIFRVNDESSDTSPFYISDSGRVAIGTTDTSGKKVNILFNSSANTVLYAENEATDASNTVGIQGIVNATGNGTNGQPVAVRGDAKNTSPTEGQYGIVGYNWATNQTSGLQGGGVFGGSVGNPSSVGDYTGRGHGVQGETYASNDNSAGGIFYSNHSTGTSVNGEADAVRGIVTSTDADAYAFKGDGKLIVSGSKSALVNTEMQGPTEMYSIESSEIWFEDIGEGQLVNGEARIQIDPLFLQTITVDQEHPIQVFIQPYGTTDMYVERDADAFTVRSIDDPNSTASFAYRIMGKREHYEDQRMLKTNGPIDHFMEPNLTAEELLLLNEGWGFGDAFRDTYYRQFTDSRGKSY